MTTTTTTTVTTTDTTTDTDTTTTIDTTTIDTTTFGFCFFPYIIPGQARLLIGLPNPTGCGGHFCQRTKVSTRH